jgi:hypothetical protein
MSSDGEIHATGDKSNVRNKLRNIKIIRWAIQNKRRGMLTYGAVLHHKNTHPQTPARSRTVLEHFNWELLAHFI